MTDNRMLVDWKGLKAMGWPYSRQHTYRLVWQGRLAAPLKFGNYRRARIAWRLSDIESFLEALPRITFNGSE